MSVTEDLYAQIADLLETATEQQVVQAHLELPQMEWINVHKIAWDNDLLLVQYTIPGPWLTVEEGELICEPARLRAVRRKFRPEVLRLQTEAELDDEIPL